MGQAALAVGCALFAAGLVATFARAGIAGRIIGLTTMALGALVVLLGAQPADPGTWWMVGSGVVTLGGLVVFARVLGRWAVARTGEPQVLDDEPT